MEKAVSFCNNCGKDEDFYVRPSGKLYQHCVKCQNAYSRKHYEANKKQYLDGNKRRERKTQDFLVQYLREHPCVDCGENHLAVLDFDHVLGQKEFNVSDAVRNGFSWARILREIKKCEVRCSNCHRKRTFGNNSKYQRTCGLTEKALVYETSR